MLIQEFLKNNPLDKLVSDYGVVVKEYDDVVVLNYDQIESPKFEPMICEARGLILDKHSNKVVSRSFDRFFNYGENGTCEDVDFSECAIYEKVDGSLIKIYYHNGEWHVSTRGTAYAESEVHGWGVTFAELVYRALGVKDKAEFNALLENSPYFHPDLTYICEVTSRENRVVTPYTGYNLYMLAVRHNHTGDYMALLDEFVAWCKSHKIKFPERFEFKSAHDCLEMVKRLKDLAEGYVVYRLGIPVCKIKSPTYVAVHRLRGDGLTPKRIADLVATNETDEYLAYFPDDEILISPYKNSFDAFMKLANEDWEKYKDIVEQKEFALQVKDKPYSNLLFQKRKNPSLSIQKIFENQSDSYKRDFVLKALQEVSIGLNELVAY